MLHPSGPSNSPVPPVERPLDAGKNAFRDYLNALSTWAEGARLAGRFPEALEAAREVLREARLPAPREFESITPEQLPSRVVPSLHSAAALALRVVARYEWYVIRDAPPAERIARIEDTRKYFECACSLEPDSIDHKKSLHAFMHDLRKARLQSTSVVSSDTERLLTSLIDYLARHEITPEVSRWVKLERTQEDRAGLVWVLDECASLSRSRAAWISHSDRDKAEDRFSSALHLAHASFALQELPTDPREFARVDLVRFSRAELKELLRACLTLEGIYTGLGEEENRHATRRFAEHVSFSFEHSENPKRDGNAIAELPVRPERKGEFPIHEIQARPPEPVVRASLPPVPVPVRHVRTEPTKASVHSQISENAWLSPCRVAAKDDPFSLSGKLLTECKRPFADIRTKFKFTPEALEKALGEFAVEIDLISRTQNDAARLYIDHYRTFIDKHLQDPIALIRIQIGVKYILDCEWLAEDIKRPARNLAELANVTLLQMGLRGDLATVQGVFRPITVAAKFNKLRLHNKRD